MGVAEVEEVAPKELEDARCSLREDRSRAPAAWRLAFDELATRLFDPDFSLQTLRRAHGLREASHSESFREHFACSPGEYVSRKRAETAVSLLGRRDLGISQVARLVGFASRRSFEKAAQRLCGLAPAVLRARMCAVPAATVAIAAPATDDAGTPRVRQLFGLALAPAEAAAEIRRLRRLHRDLEVLGEPDLEAFERRVAEQWWCFLRELPAGEWPTALAGGLFQTPALFEALCRASREEGRDHRQRGVEIAELALESLRLLRGSLDAGRLVRLESRGWAYLGNALALALDYPAAERCFETARARISGHPEAGATIAEVLYLESGLRRFQRRFDDARALTEQALASCPQGPSRLRGELLLGRGIVSWHLGEQTLALADYRAGLGMLDPERDPYLVCVATHNIADSLCRAGEHEEASRWLMRAEPLARRLGQRGPLCRILWLGGLLEAHLGRPEPAARSLREAHGGLLALGDRGHAAIAALDLAELETRAGRVDAALALIAQTLPPLEALGLEAEALSALALLRRSLETRQLTAGRLSALRAALGRALGAPTL